MTIQLRQARKEDLPILDEFQQQLVKLERGFDKGIPTQGRVDYYNLESLLMSDKVHFLVVEVDNKVVGCGFGEIRKNVDWAVDKEYGYIGLVFVKEEYRYQGIGKKIVGSIFDWFHSKNISHITVEVYAENKEAIEAYTSYGFEHFVCQMKYGK